ncbi:MAG: Gfo/Idh/MocA family oxidoreductase [Dehalococcoidia bacterium]|nr:Gfo/Idh/MocA family oxidoreductase [Dehalococcoidia bacterium]
MAHTTLPNVKGLLKQEHKTVTGKTPAKSSGKTTRTLGVAVLGTGRIGGSYIDVVNKIKGAEVVVVAEPREEQVAPLKKKHPGIEFVADYKEALAMPEVDFIIGTLPHWLHKKAAIDAAKAGKHIYIEKPMAVTLAECDEMLAAAKKAGVKLMTAHTQRYYPAVAKAKAVIDSGDLGNLVMVYDYWHKPYQPETRPKWMLDRKLGGGMGQMDGTHQLDRTLWIAGNDVYSVSAKVGSITHPELPCDDTGMLFLRFKSGIAATLARFAWDKGATEYGADYFLTKGMVRMRIAYGRGQGQATGVWIGDTPQGTWKEIPCDNNDNSLVDEVQAFVDSLRRGDADTPVPQMHGRNVMEILEASETSQETGREVIIKK